MIITVINQKGGLGKATLAVHLACWFLDQGMSVAFIDADAQESSRRWLHRIDPTIPVFCPRTGNDVHQQVVVADATADVVKCDGPPPVAKDLPRSEPAVSRAVGTPRPAASSTSTVRERVDFEIETGRGTQSVTFRVPKELAGWLKLMAVQCELSDSGGPRTINEIGSTH